MHSIVAERSPTGSLGKNNRSNMVHYSHWVPEDDFLICGPSLASIPRGNLSETIMQIHRCMPRPNNWTPASKYFKMPFCSLLIMFRPQCEETGQEDVGVVHRARAPARPQPPSRAIKKGFLTHRIYYQTPYDSGSKLSAVLISVMPLSPHAGGMRSCRPGMFLIPRLVPTQHRLHLPHVSNQQVWMNSAFLSWQTASTWVCVWVLETFL